MKNTRKLLSALLVVALLILSAVPAFAVYVDTDPETFMWTTTEKTISYYSSSININGLTKKSTITDVKSSKPSVISIDYIRKDKNTSETTYFDPAKKETSNGYSAYIGLRIKKTGKATISFKVDGKAYKKVITVLSYENPVKSLQLTGVNTKNLKSLFDKKNTVNGSLSKNAKAGAIKVTAANGWKVMRIYWRDTSNTYNDRAYGFGGDGVASASMAIPAMNKDTSYYMYVWFYNANLNVYEYVYYYLQPASSNHR